MKKTSLLFSLVIFSACVPPRAPVVRKPLPIQDHATRRVRVNPPQLVLIGIRVDVSESTLIMDGPFESLSWSSGVRRDWSGGRYKILALSGHLMMDGHNLGTKVRFVSKSEDCYLQIGNSVYRGNIIVRAVGDSKLTVVNELDIDDYLKGVLPREVVVTWPSECLKAQAVASRTYLASHLGKHSSQGFDLCADVHCQVYGGMAKEHPSVINAVDDTSGEILVYEGEPIGAFFYSNCGGVTEEIYPVWGQENRDYLTRKHCGYGTGDPRYFWKFTYTDGDMLSILKSKTKVKGKELISFRVKKKSGSGRAQTVTVRTDQEAYDLSGNDFRIALNPEKIRSTLWTSVTRHNHATTFEGKGWGHGVGMCQWGAKGQAESGRDYKQILSFYYPHTSLELWKRK